MKKLFYLGVIGLTLFEVLNVFFIMPMPGSQEINSLGLAYFLYRFRWVFRVLFLVMMLAGVRQVFQARRKWVPALLILLALAVTWTFNFKMSADSMFEQPHVLAFGDRAENKLSDSTVIIGVAYNGEAKAYPVRYIVYHHQVRDTVGGKAVMVTYCSVCRTGRVFEPLVNNVPENFRLVGMDHFNAMFEDKTTGSWWRQATGEAVAGKLKGTTLPELASDQMTLGKWFFLYPNAQVMQVDSVSKDFYDTKGKFERGKSKGDLTRTDSLSWKNKSWVVGIIVDGKSKAYDWKKLESERAIHDVVGNTSLVVLLSVDGQSFAAFEEAANAPLSMSGDTIFRDTSAYDFSGRPLSAAGPSLKRIQAYQEFWHSWKTFHPETTN